MEAKSQAKNVRMAPRKVRQLRETVIGLPVGEAGAQLKFRSGKAARILQCLLNSAVANAVNNLDLKEANLRVKMVTVDGGIKLKRFRPVSKGMAHPFVKRMSHVEIVVEEIEPGKPKKKRRQGKIETVAAADYIKKKRASEKVPEIKEGKQAESVDKQAVTEEELKVYEKMKMQQQGGDRKKNRRRQSR
jgi:large subunit ribosomal protein L22